MHVMEGSPVPNVMSIGRRVQRDKSGRPGVAIFPEKRAVMIRGDESFMNGLQKLIDEAAAAGQVEGTATQSNFVYHEHFGTNPDLSRGEFGENMKVYPVVGHRMFNNRLKLDSDDQLIEMLRSAGISQTALLNGIKFDTLHGLPPKLTLDKVTKFFDTVGKDADFLTAEITQFPLRRNIESEATDVSGEMLVIDNIDPPFSRMATDDPFIGEDSRSRTAKLQVVPSLGGYRDAVLAVDIGSGFAELIGRSTKKDPHKIVGRFVVNWKRRWNKLQKVKVDAEFNTEKTQLLLTKVGVEVRQSVPGDHRMNTGKVEGIIRWIQDSAQVFMNQTKELVVQGYITERIRKRFWFHALKQAVIAYNLKPALNDKL